MTKSRIDSVFESIKYYDISYQEANQVYSGLAVNTFTLDV